MKRTMSIIREHCDTAIAGTKSIITENREAVSKLLKEPDTNLPDKLQYKVMMLNLNCMLNIVTWLQNMRQSQRTK